MTGYIARRLLLLPVILMGVTMIIFAMVSLLSPGQRASLYVGDIQRQTGSLDAVIEKYGLNDPIPEQYWRWLKSVLGGNLGFSKVGKLPVTEVIKQRFPATVELALWAVIPIIGVGVYLGVIAALNHNRTKDHVLRFFSIFGTSLPTFVFGLLVLLLFSAWLGILPAGGRLSVEAQRLVDSPAWNEVTGLYTIDSIINARPAIFVDALRHLLLPVLTLSFLSWAVLLRVTRSSMLDTLRQDYVRTAQAKGLSWNKVVNQHARPNAMLPVATIGGLQLVALLNGVVITETVFNYPGLGKTFADAASNLDIVTVLGLTMFNAVLLVIGNLGVDLVYARLDPRVRLT